MFIQRVRVRFKKLREVRTISHLDLMRAFERALRRAGLPLRMSEGFNPRPRISMPMPLAVGMEGLDEVLEFELAEWLVPAEIERRLRGQLPRGLEFVSLKLARPRESAQAAEATYRVRPRATVQDDARLAAHAWVGFTAREEVPVRRFRKGKHKTVNIRPYVISAARAGDDIIMRVKAGPGGSTRPEEILGAVGFEEETCRSEFRIIRTRVKLADEPSDPDEEMQNG